MSTKAIRGWLKTTGCSFAPGCSHCAALREVEAIEQAAKDATCLDADEARVAWWESEDAAKWDGVTDTLKAVAKSAPK